MIKKYFVIFIILSFLPVNIYVVESNVLSGKITNQKKFDIDISELMAFYETLAADEKNEQIRDWALYGLIAQLEILPNKASGIPMRYTNIKNKNEISPGRIKHIGNNDCIVIVAQDKFADKSLIGSIVDKDFAQTNSVPKSIYIFEYTVNFSSNSITVSYVQTISGNQIFSQEYNYFEKEVKNLDDFKELTSKIDDITKIQWKEKSIVFGGRKYSSSDIMAIPLESIASLYQAYNMPISKEKKEAYKNNYENFISQKYQEVINNDKRLKKAIASGSVKKSHILDEIRKKIPYVEPEERESNIGFSLDPSFNYSGICDDLLKISKKDPQFINPQDTEFIAFIDSNTANIISAAEKIKSQYSIEHLLIMRRKIANSKIQIEQRFDSLLQHIELKNSYQSARYDGLLQGTISGMILFYTDLTAKLWAIDYNGLAPRKYITGFRVMPEIKVPKLYWDDFIKLSNTRLWFGLRQESFEIYNNKLLFEPTATRVYAASANPLFPGKEAKPNFPSAEFLGWWDLHYSAVADYEPQYHRLNQIQKWGCIFTVLKEEKSHLLDFLFQVPVVRNLDYETWYKNTDYLKIKTDIPFTDRTKYNKKTECLELLHSSNYSLMRHSFFLSGGVSLASRKDIISKLHKKQVEQGISKKPKVGTMPKLGPLEGEGELKKPKISVADTSGKPAVSQTKPESNSKNYGNFSVERQKDKIKLKWEKGADVILNDFINALVSIQEKKQAGYKDENIFHSLSDIERVIRIEQWTTYLIKNKNIKNKWIYLNINKSDKAFDYPVKAAGTEYDSDIFYARLVTEDKKNKLISGKQPKVGTLPKLGPLKGEVPTDIFPVK